MFSFLLFAAIIIVPTVIANDITVARHLNFSLGSIIVMLVLGIVAAGSMVIPGVSGSMILMMLGYYDTILENITTFIKALTSFDIITMFSCCGILIPFGIGVLIGIIATAKIIEKLLNTYPNATMWGIMALVVTSPFAILYGVNLNISGIMLLTSIVTFVLGFFVARKMSE